jgi:mRNA-degrading endonuclease toxin of MazEF toxin-antitoxin module
MGSVDLRAGTRGPDGRGFPVPSAVCGDYTGSGSSATAPDTSGTPLPVATVACDAATPQASGRASAHALALPDATAPQLSVARVASQVRAARTANGQVTVAFASAQGVQIGPLTIAEIRALAVSKAHGRKGTASAVLVREICGLSMAAQAEPEDKAAVDATGGRCLNAEGEQVQALFDQLNATALQKVQLSVPQGSATASPGGYQAVVTKHPGQRGADQTVNDDDSHTVSAVQIVLYNDGGRGRQRLVVQLGGVHAESRYGVVELPNFTGGDVAFPEPAGDIPPADVPAPDAAYGEPGGVASVDPAIPVSYYADDLDGYEAVRFSATPPARTASLPDRRVGVPRVLQVPLAILSDGFYLLVQHPREAGLLAAVFALLALPLYLGVRRRSFAHALAPG